MLLKKLQQADSQIIKQKSNHRICYDLIGKCKMTPSKGGRKYAMKGKKDKNVCLQVFSMMESNIGWIEIHSVPEGRIDLVTNQVELAWLIRYRLPNNITVGWG